MMTTTTTTTTTTTVSLYDLLNMTHKNSVLKSVFVHPTLDEDNNLIVEVETYDNTFLNVVNGSANRKDQVFEYINNTLIDNFNTIKDYTNLQINGFRVTHYSLFDYHMENVITPCSLLDYYKQKENWYMFITKKGNPYTKF